KRIRSSTLKRIEVSARTYERLGHQAKTDTRKLIELNRELHFQLYNASGMPMLVSLIDNIWTHIAPVFALSMSLKERTVDDRESFRYHERLLNSLSEKDGDAAGDAVLSYNKGAAIFKENALWPRQQV